jgi:hypothetical protein
MVCGKEQKSQKNGEGRAAATPYSAQYYFDLAVPMLGDIWFLRDFFA